MRHKNKFLAWVMTGIIIIGLTGCAAVEENEIIPQDNSGYENSESETEIINETAPAVVTTTLSNTNEVIYTSLTTIDNMPENSTLNEIDATRTPAVVNLRSGINKDEIEILKKQDNILFFIENEGVDLSFLNELENLKDLKILQGKQSDTLGFGNYFTNIFDFTFLDGLKIKSLYLDCGGLAFDFEKINLLELDDLTLTNVKINNKMKKVNIPSLKNLTFSFADIKDLELLNDLELELLDISFCVFKNNNLDIINDFITLEKFKIYACHDIFFSRLDGLINLKTLVLNQMSIKYDIEIVYELTWVEEIYIYFSLITDEQINEYNEKNPIGEIRMLDA